MKTCTLLALFLVSRELVRSSGKCLNNINPRGLQVEEGRSYCDTPLENAALVSGKHFLSFQAVALKAINVQTHLLFCSSAFSAFSFHCSSFTFNVSFCAPLFHFCSLSRTPPQIESEWVPNRVQVQQETLPTLFAQSSCLVNYYQHTHKQMQTALSGSRSRAVGAHAAVPSLSRNE